MQSIAPETFGRRPQGAICVNPPSSWPKRSLKAFSTAQCGEQMLVLLNAPLRPTFAQRVIPSASQLMRSTTTAFADQCERRPEHRVSVRE